MSDSINLSPPETIKINSRNLVPKISINPSARSALTTTKSRHIFPSNSKQVSEFKHSDINFEQKKRSVVTGWLERKIMLKYHMVKLDTENTISQDEDCPISTTSRNNYVKTKSLPRLRSSMGSSKKLQTIYGTSKESLQVFKNPVTEKPYYIISVKRRKSEQANAGTAKFNCVKNILFGIIDNKGHYEFPKTESNSIIKPEPLFSAVNQEKIIVPIEPKIKISTLENPPKTAVPSPKKREDYTKKEWDEAKEYYSQRLENKRKIANVQVNEKWRAKSAKRGFIQIQEIINKCDNLLNEDKIMKNKAKKILLNVKMQTEKTDELLKYRPKTDTEEKELRKKRGPKRIRIAFNARMKDLK